MDLPARRDKRSEWGRWAQQWHKVKMGDPPFEVSVSDVNRTRSSLSYFHAKHPEIRFATRYMGDGMYRIWRIM